MTRRSAVLREVAAVSGLAALAIALAEGLAALVPGFDAHAGTLIAAAFVLLPLGAARWLKLPGDVLGTEGPPIWRGVALGLVSSVIVLLPFAAGFDTLQVHGFGVLRGGPGLRSAGEVFQGSPRPPHTPAIAVYEQGQGLAIENGTAAAVVIHPSCPGCPTRLLAPGARTVLDAKTAAQFDLRELGGQRVTVPVRGGADGVTLELPIRARPDLLWLLWLLLAQVVAVAAPEEMFFRGYVLGRLRTVLPPRRRILGVPFGAAHVISALLFALIHLVAIPEPGRLLVFFPGLLFAWLAERGGSVTAPIVQHALANFTLRALQCLYG